MENRESVVGQLLHEMVTLFPIVLLSGSLLFDGAGMLTHGGGFYSISYWMITEGMVGGLVAVVLGFTRLSDIPAETREHDLYRARLIADAAIMGLMALSLALRYTAGASHPGPAGIELSFLGTALLLLNTRLGGTAEAEPQTRATGHHAGTKKMTSRTA